MLKGINDPPGRLPGTIRLGLPPSLYAETPAGRPCLDNRRTLAPELGAAEYEDYNHVLRVHAVGGRRHAVIH